MRCVGHCMEHLRGVQRGTFQRLLKRFNADKGVTIEQVEPLFSKVGLKLKLILPGFKTLKDAAVELANGRYFAVVRQPEGLHGVVLTLTDNSADIWDWAVGNNSDKPLIKIWKVIEK